MSDQHELQSAHSDQLLRDLRQLIAALDRRVPQLSHSRESGIAREAADLRTRAVRLIRQLQGEPAEALLDSTLAALPFVQE